MHRGKLTPPTQTQLTTAWASAYNVVTMRVGKSAVGASVLIAVILLGAAIGSVASTPSRSDLARRLTELAKIDATDRAALLNQLLLDGEASFLIILDEQADLRAASALQDKSAKGHFVFDALRAVAARTQPALIAALRTLGAQVRPFIIVNAIGVRGNLQSLLVAAESPHVARIVADTPVRADLPSPDVQPHPSSLSLQPFAVEWGVSNINAPAVWTLGYTGAGIVIGGQDTGVRWDHTALKNKYRGWNGASVNHNFNWHDSIHTAPGNVCGDDSPAPCDDDSHGTHTVGTVVGDDSAGNQIGVAPGAQWIACRNMDAGVGRPSTYLECFEWFLAPYPITGTVAEGDPAKAPHILNNSWGCPDFEGCITGQEVISGVQAMRAAGILTVVSAGNAGPGCSSVNDAPGIYAESFSVGAYASGGSIASFSSRGPVTLDGSGRQKPDIAAPGVGVRSATNGSTNSYASFSGTSMAGPHVAGAAALLWDAAPYLIGEVELTEWVLRLSATPTLQSQNCGADTAASHPNNVWGWGKVNAFAAVSATLSLTPTAVLTFTQISSDSFVLDASASTDPETPSADLLVRWDFGGDGVWDTPWSFNKMVTGTSDLLFPSAVVQIADWGGRAALGLLIPPSLDSKFYLPLVWKNP